MSTYLVRALVLRKTKLGEADIIVTLLSGEGSIVRAVAKGMRKPTSRFSGRLEPGSVVDLLLAPGRSLEIVSDVRSVDLHSGLRLDYERSTSASVVFDVLDKIAVENQPEPRLFGLACATLSALEAAPADRLTQVVSAYLVKAMAMHGYRPHLDSCLSCGSVAQTWAGFSLDGGGLLCVACGGVVAPLSTDARDLVAWMLRATMNEVAESEVPARHVSESFALIRQFVVYHLPARLKALELFAGGGAR